MLLPHLMALIQFMVLIQFNIYCTSDINNNFHNSVLILLG